MRAIGAVVLLAIVAILAATYVYGASRRGATTRDVRRRLDATRTSIQPSVVDFGQLAWLPGPAQEYFQTVLRGVSSGSDRRLARTGRSARYR